MEVVLWMIFRVFLAVRSSRTLSRLAWSIPFFPSIVAGCAQYREGTAIRHLEDSVVGLISVGCPAERLCDPLRNRAITWTCMCGQADREPGFVARRAPVIQSEAVLEPDYEDPQNSASGTAMQRLYRILIYKSAYLMWKLKRDGDLERRTTMNSSAAVTTLCGFKPPQRVRVLIVDCPPVAPTRFLLVFLPNSPSLNR